ncbi:3-oxoacyl-ACP reductase [Niveibacterium umoris]|uniref:3-oxoacyl-[acyl-carrier protein] reductase n=1 Tax=Niveibacterium umoris TaxID=1193620 RepID=A0A840BM95_9RHOO|nr:3-oxoacyl-ACP reductase [Niveibacterium umoris]MBB4014671.1 3-oxoacyl-[acyl-carrier protein] reductase [Niveibacterium umoris]
MADLLLRLANDRRSAGLIRKLGLPTPVRLARAEGAYDDAPLAGRVTLVGAAPGGLAVDALQKAAAEAGATCVAALAEGQSADTLLFDATACRAPADLAALHGFFAPKLRRLARNARVLVVSADPSELADPVAAATARGIEGFVRALGKEIGRRGATANLARLAPGAESQLAGLVRFCGGPRCTYVSGQVFRLTSAPAPAPAARQLAGKVAVVTGAARGIGAATAQRLSEEGARVVCVDVAAARDALYETAARVGGLPLVLDIAAPDAPAALSAFLREKTRGVDVLVHNAGITRDKTLANMKPDVWDAVIAVNFTAITAIDAELLANGLLHDSGRVVCLSSVSGVAGNFGQTNYATSKAALIGYVAAQAPRLAARGITINAVAPGFIETPMTARIPLMMREAGRRLNALSQGGQPRDVAELVTFFALPASAGVSGNTVRACGLALIGA